MSKTVKRISQVGVIVRDLDKAMEYYDKLLDISSWNVLDTDLLPELEVNGEVGKKLNIKLAITTMNNGFEIELIQPKGDGPFMEHLEKYGPGVHHFAIVMPDKNARFKELYDTMISEGGKPWIHARMTQEQGMDFTYMDLREQMGAIIEMYNEPRD